MKHILPPIMNRVRSMLCRAGYQLCSVERFGLDFEHDLRRLTEAEAISVVFDVGANVGQTALRCVQAFPQADVLSFEPVPETFAELQRNTRGLDRVQTFNQAMGASAGRATMHVAAWSVTTSFIESGAATGRTVEVNVGTIDDFCQHRGIHQIDLLKIDVEGFETQVLQGAKSMLGKGDIRYIYAECDFAPNPDSPHASFFNLTSFLTEQGYCVVAVYSESFSLGHGSSLCNVLYAAKTRLPALASGRTKNIV